MKENRMMLVSIESPFSASTKEGIHRNIAYAVLAAKDTAKNYGECPFASHLILTQTVISGEHTYISDSTPDPYGIGRDQAIALTHEARLKCDKIVFYTDLGWSSGMHAARELAQTNGIEIEERTLPEEMMSQLSE